MLTSVIPKDAQYDANREYARLVFVRYGGVVGYGDVAVCVTALKMPGSAVQVCPCPPLLFRTTPRLWAIWLSSVVHLEASS